MLESFSLAEGGSSADTIESLKEIATSLIQKMGVIANVNAKIDIDPETEEENIRINIESEDGSLLIGQGGSHLVAMQHLLRALISKKSEKPVRFLVDVNDYRHERLGFLEQLAESSAREAFRNKERVTLRPMSSFERRIIHKALTDNEFVETESVGVEPERKVIIKLKEKA